MLQTYYMISFKSDLYQGKTELAGILTYLKREMPDLTDDDLFELRVIYSELINNAIVHGNHFDKEKKVEMFVEINDRDITSRVRDEGSGFDYQRFLRKPDDLMCDHGRGLQLVLSFADCIQFNERGNEIVFSKKFK